MFSLCLPHRAVPYAGRLTCGRGDSEETDGWGVDGSSVLMHIRLREHLDGNRSFRVCEGGWNSLCLEHPRDVSVTLQRDQTRRCTSEFVSILPLLWLQLLWHLHPGVVVKVGSPHQLPHLSFGSCVPEMQHHDLSLQGSGSPHCLPGSLELWIPHAAGVGLGFATDTQHWHSEEWCWRLALVLLILPMPSA